MNTRHSRFNGAAAFAADQLDKDGINDSGYLTLQWSCGIRRRSTQISGVKLLTNDELQWSCGIRRRSTLERSIEYTLDNVLQWSCGIRRRSTSDLA